MTVRVLMMAALLALGARAQSQEAPAPDPRAAATARAQPASAGALAQALRGDPQSAATVQDVTIGEDIFAAVALTGGAMPGAPTWLPVSVESLEKLTG